MAFIVKNIINNMNNDENKVTFWTGTQQEYEQIIKKQEGRLYFINDKGKIFLRDTPMSYDLPREYDEYLSSVTYKIPDIHNFSVSTSGVYEPGYNVSSTHNISYIISNSKNVQDGICHIGINNINMVDVPVSDESQNLNINFDIDNDTECVHTFSASLMSTKNHHVQKSSNIYFKFPLLYGSNGAVLDGIYDKFKSAGNITFSNTFIGNNYNIENTENDSCYIWFCVPEENTFDLRACKVTSGGFNVPIDATEYKTNVINVNGISKIYKCYRTLSNINTGTYKINISL